MGFDQRKVGLDRIFEHIVTPVDLASLFPFRQRRTVAGWSENRAEARPCRLNTRREVPLRNQLQLDFAAAIEVIENLRVNLPRERADHFAHPPGFQQRRQSHFAIARIVVDNG